MVSKRRPLHPNSSSRLNFRPNASDTQKPEGRGSKPLPDPSSIADILLMMILHGCRKVVFFDTKIKVAIYLCSLFILSLLADVLPFPRTYFSRKDNIFNVYFVKVAWGWTLILTIPFVVFTSYTTCCGKRERVLKHLIRLGVATATWFCWVNAFNLIESYYGKCNAKGEKFQTKSACLAAGHFWQGFDLSGHVFILVYSCLVIIEEARAIIGWEGIRDMIRNEDFNRTINETNGIGTSLKGLSLKDFESMKESYERFTPLVRILFIAMSLITVLWDVMLLMTILYFHHMVEKFSSGIIAVFMWFITYQVWYPTRGVLPELPGEGMFKYKDVKQSKDLPLKKKSIPQKGDLPRFMGMPLTGLRNQENSEERNNVFSVETDVSAL